MGHFVSAAFDTSPLSLEVDCGWWAGGLLLVFHLVVWITKKSFKLFSEICYMSESYIIWSWVSAWFTRVSDSCGREIHSATEGSLTKDSSMALSDSKEFFVLPFILTCPCCLEMCNLRIHNAPHLVISSQVELKVKVKWCKPKWNIDMQWSWFC